MEKTPVAIILINWNNYSDTIQCLNSLKNNSYLHSDIYVLDNGSLNDSYERLIKYKESNLDLNLLIYKSGKNLGFSGGNNFVINKILDKSYEYFWLLNNDTVIHPDALTCLIRTVQKDKTIGLAGSKILHLGTKKLLFAGGRIDKRTVRGISIGHNEEDLGQFDDLSDIDYVSGCSLLASREVLDNVGFMENDYFLYYEDTDWNLRVRSAGFNIKVVSDSIVYHKPGSSTGGDYKAPFLLYYNIRNRYITAKRNPQYFSKTGPLLYLFTRSAVLLFNVWLKKKKKVIRTYYILKAIIDALRGKLGKLEKHII